VRAKEFLTPGQLPLEGILHTINKRGFVVQVRDHRCNMGQPFHAYERRAAFEINENEVELFR
jgi:hypothetical protein